MRSVPDTPELTPTTPIVEGDSCGVPPPELTPAVSEQRLRVILDTDFGPDVDDVGALAMLHTLADAGEVEILAVMVSSNGGEAGYQSVDAVNTYYGRPNTPIGVASSSAPRTMSLYTAELADRFEHDIESPPLAGNLYRRILADQPDGTVTVISIGFLTNLADLLASEPDGHSMLSGEELVSAKVKLWVAQGGYYPDSVDHPRGRAFNFFRDPIAALFAVSSWPTPAVFSGWEVGSEIETGAVLQNETPPENPVREAYRLFTGGGNRASFDLTAVHYAVRGPADLFEVCPGRNILAPDGSNTWEFSAADQGYLKLSVAPEQVATILDSLLTRMPAAAATE